MNIFEKISKEQENNIIQREEALMPDFFPTEFLHRESETREVASVLKKVTEGNNCESAFVFGSPGTGKTSVCKNVLKQLREFSSKTACVYVNCWQANTRQAILSKIAGEMQLLIPRRGLSNEEFNDTLTEFLKKQGKAIAIILDEADRLFEGKSEEILYDLSRNREMHGISTSIICISNERGLFQKIDARIKSSLQLKQIEFKQYTPTELKDILSQRAKLALKTGSYDEGIISLCAAQGAKNLGDARLAIQVLLKSAKNAEGENSLKISIGHVRAAIEEANSTHSKEKDENISEIESQILNFLQENGKTQASKIYEEIKSKTNYSERSIRNSLAKLQERMKIRREVEEGKGKTNYYAAI